MIIFSEYPIYHYTHGYADTGQHHSNPIGSELDDPLAVTERMAVATAFSVQVPGYVPRTQAECQVLADMFHAALIQADATREDVPVGRSISLRPVLPIAGPSSLVT